MMGYAEIIKKKMKDWDAPNLMETSIGDSGDRIPFTSPMLTFATYGGIKRDTLTEFFGVESGGKSTSALDICKNAVTLFQKEYEEKLAALQEKASSGDKSAKSAVEDLQDVGRKKILYIDLEHSYDRNWSDVIGIEDGSIDVMQPPVVSGEEILQTVLEVIESGEVGLIVLDSVPSIESQRELDKKLGEATVASLAGLLTTFLKKAIPLLSRYHCTMIVINQLRDDMNNPYNHMKTPGGRALKFWSSLRLYFQRGEKVDFLGNQLPHNAEDTAGFTLKAKVIKQKTAPNDRTNASYILMAREGIAPMYDFAKLAITKYNIIQKHAGWFTMCDPSTGEILEKDGKPFKINGLAKVYDYLRENPDYYNSLVDFVMEDLKNSTNGASGEEDELY